MIAVSNLIKRFRTGGAEVTAVDGVSVDIATGSMVAITGPSGPGKSTLLHLIGAIETADSGTVTVEGVEVTSWRRGKLSTYRRGVGFVFQRYHLIPTLTALDNVVAPAIPHRVSFNKSARARELLAAVGLSGSESSLPAQLSGGQQQRVAIARALVGSPKLVLADEPTGNLDSGTGSEILELLGTIRRDHGATVLIATHEQHVAASCDRIIRLRNGAVVDDLGLLGGESPLSPPSPASAACVRDSLRNPQGFGYHDRPRLRPMIGQLVSLRAASLAFAVGAAIVIVPAVPAMASGGCSGSRITINSNPGAEPPSVRTGHRHLTGNHYIRSVRPVDGGKIVVWWADNNGGLDGDTADTFYTNTFC